MTHINSCSAQRILTLILSFALYFLWSGAAQAIDVWVSGSWNETIDRNDLRAGIGTDVNSTYTSAQNTNLVTVTGTTSKNDKWQVNIKRIDTTWDNRMQVFARRTSGGAGQGSVTGGEAFIQVTQNDTVFFTGTGNLNNIRVQLQLTGASLQIPPNQYTSTIQYTIIDTP